MQRERRQRDGGDHDHGERHLRRHDVQPRARAPCHQVHQREGEGEQHVRVADIAAPVEVHAGGAHACGHERADADAHDRREQPVRHGQLDQHADAHEQHERAQKQRPIAADERLDLVFLDRGRHRARSRERVVVRRRSATL